MSTDGPIQISQSYETNKCRIHKFDSDINLLINDDLLSAAPITKEGFAFMWAGCRSDKGVKGGKAWFELTVGEDINVDHLPHTEKTRHVLRVGWSALGANLQLGECPLSYGYGGTGKFSTNNKFKMYGQAFAKGDVIGCFVDYSNKSKVILSYTKNGVNLYVASLIYDLNDASLFPHIFTKNCAFVCNFGGSQPLFPPISNDYAMIQNVNPDFLDTNVQGPSNFSDCEVGRCTLDENTPRCTLTCMRLSIIFNFVFCDHIPYEMIMMCGLPGAGKSFWAKNYSEKHLDKKFCILGTNLIMEKMKVIGVVRKRNYAGRWDTLISLATNCLNHILSFAFQQKRNYILDQTNVYASARQRKLSKFGEFKKRAIVIVPEENEFKRRIALRNENEGKEVPEKSVLDMKANFKLPSMKDNFFASIEFVELPESEAVNLVSKYNQEAMSKGHYPNHLAAKRPIRVEETSRNREGVANNNTSSHSPSDSKRQRFLKPANQYSANSSPMVRQQHTPRPRPPVHPINASHSHPVAPMQNYYGMPQPWMMMPGQPAYSAMGYPNQASYSPSQHMAVNNNPQYYFASYQQQQVQNPPMLAQSYQSYMQYNSGLYSSSPSSSAIMAKGMRPGYTYRPSSRD